MFQSPAARQLIAARLCLSRGDASISSDEIEGPRASCSTADIPVPIRAEIVTCSSYRVRPALERLAANCDTLPGLRSTEEICISGETFSSRAG